MKQVALEGFLKKNKNTEIYPGPSQQLRWSSLWHQLVAFIGAMGVLNAPLEYCNVF